MSTTIYPDGVMVEISVDGVVKTKSTPCLLCFDCIYASFIE